MEIQESKHTFSVEQLREFIISVLRTYDVKKEHAILIADIYLTAEEYGHGSHGLQRFEKLIEGIETDTHRPDFIFSILKETASTALVDGGSGLGVIVADKAMDIAIEKAKKTGIACVGVTNTTHFGIAGYYARKAAIQNMIGVAVCNTQPAIAPYQGKGKVLGTNPIAIAIPSAKEPVVLDMSVAGMARGKIFEAARKGLPIKEHAAVDKEGNMTTDPHKALEGFLLPYGGDYAYKTFGLAFMIDVLSGILTGSGFGTLVTGTADTTKPCTKGDFFIAINIEHFRSIKDFIIDTEQLKSMVKACGLNVLLPGEKELNNKNANKGIIHLDDQLYSMMKKISEKTAIPLP